MIYDFPEYYETAFSFRDIKEEARTLQLAIEKFSRINVREILEIASGPAPHAGELVKAGYSYTGLDNNKNMIDHAKSKWKNQLQQINFLEADMKTFEIDENQKFDFSFVMLGSLYTKCRKEVTSHFDSMANALNKGALYFLDSCIQFSDPENHHMNQYTIEKNGIIINSRFYIKLLDESRNLYEEIWTLNVNDNGKYQEFEMTEENEAILPQKFKSFIAQRNDFEIVGWWDDWKFECPIENIDNSDTKFHSTNRSIVILRRI